MGQFFNNFEYPDTFYMTIYKLLNFRNFFRKLVKKTSNLNSNFVYSLKILVDSELKPLLTLNKKMQPNLISELLEWSDNEVCDIFITMPVRKKGNPHCYFEKYLRDLEELSENPAAIITYVTLDDDDDFKFFLKLKRKYQGKLRLRFFIAPQSGGYAGTHKLHANMIEKNLTNFSIWILGASDAQPVFQGWDSELLNCVSESLGRCFIGAGPLEHAGSLHGPFPDDNFPIYWVGTDDFVFASKQTLDIIREEVKSLDGWYSVGNTWHIDGFFAELVRQCAQKKHPQIFVPTKPLIIERNPRGWFGVADREKNRTNTLKKYFDLEPQLIHSRISQALIDFNNGEVGKITKFR